DNMLLGTGMAALVLQNTTLPQFNPSRIVGSVCSSSTIVLAVYPTPITASNGSVSTSYSLSLVNGSSTQTTVDSAILTSSSYGSAGSSAPATGPASLTTALSLTSSDLLSSGIPSSSTVRSLSSSGASEIISVATTVATSTSASSVLSSIATSLSTRSSSASTTSLNPISTNRAFLSCPADDGLYYADTNDRVYQLRCGTDEPDNTIGTSSQSSLQDCVRACTNFGGCTSASYDVSSNLCSYQGTTSSRMSLRKRQDTSTTDSATLTDYVCPDVDGTRLLDSSGSIFETQCNTFLPASNTTSFTADDLVSCFSFCSNSAGCSSVTFQNQICTLISNGNSGAGVFRNNVASAFLLGTRQGLSIPSTIVPSLSIPTTIIPSLSIPAISSIPSPVVPSLLSSILSTAIGIGSSALQVPTPSVDVSAVLSQVSSLLPTTIDPLTILPSTLPVLPSVSTVIGGVTTLIPAVSLPSTLPVLPSASTLLDGLTTLVPVISAIPTSLPGAIASDASVIASEIGNAASSILSQATGVVSAIGDPLTLIPSSLVVIPTISSLPSVDGLTTLVATIPSVPTISLVPSVISDVASDASAIASEVGDAISSVLSNIPIITAIPTLPTLPAIPTISPVPSLISIVASDASVIVSDVGGIVSSILSNVPIITAIPTLPTISPVPSLISVIASDAGVIVSNVGDVASSVLSNLPTITPVQSIISVVASDLSVVVSDVGNAASSVIGRLTTLLDGVPQITALPTVTVPSIAPILSEGAGVVSSLLDATTLIGPVITGGVSLPTNLPIPTLVDPTTLLGATTLLAPIITGVASLPTLVTVALPSPTCLTYDQLLNICLDAVATSSGNVGAGINVGLTLGSIPIVEASITLGLASTALPSVDVGVSLGPISAGVGLGTNGLSLSLGGSSQPTTVISLPAVSVGNSGIGVAIGSSTVTLLDPSASLNIVPSVISIGSSGVALPSSIPISLDLGIGSSTIISIAPILSTTTIPISVAPIVSAIVNSALSTDSSGLVLPDLSTSVGLLPSVVSINIVQLPSSTLSLNLLPSSSLDLGLSPSSTISIVLLPSSTLSLNLLPSSTLNLGLTQSSTLLNLGLTQSSTLLNLGSTPSSTLLNVDLTPSSTLNLGLGLGGSGSSATASSSAVFIRTSTATSTATSAAGLDLGLGGVGLGGQSGSSTSIVSSRPASTSSSTTNSAIVVVPTSSLVAVGALPVGQSSSSIPVSSTSISSSSSSTRPTSTSVSTSTSIRATSTSTAGLVQGVVSGVAGGLRQVVHTRAPAHHAQMPTRRPRFTTVVKPSDSLKLCMSDFYICTLGIIYDYHCRERTIRPSITIPLVTTEYTSAQEQTGRSDAAISYSSSTTPPRGEEQTIPVDSRSSSLQGSQDITVSLTPTWSPLSTGHLSVSPGSSSESTSTLTLVLSNASESSLSQISTSSSRTPASRSDTQSLSGLSVTTSTGSTTSTSSVSPSVAASTNPVLYTCPRDNGIYYSDTENRVYQLLCNTDESDATIGMDYQPHLQSCVDSCGDISGCLGVSYSETTGLCSYKSSASNRVGSSSSNSAILADYLVDSSGSIYQILCNTFFPASNNITSNLETPDLASCSEICSDTSDCSGFTFQNGTCTLVNNRNSNDGIARVNVATAILLSKRIVQVVSSGIPYRSTSLAESLPLDISRTHSSTRQSLTMNSTTTRTSQSLLSTVGSAIPISSETTSTNTDTVSLRLSIIPSSNSLSSGLPSTISPERTVSASSTIIPASISSDGAPIQPADSLSAHSRDVEHIKSSETISSGIRDFSVITEPQSSITNGLPTIVVRSSQTAAVFSTTSLPTSFSQSLLSTISGNSFSTDIASLSSTLVSATTSAVIIISRPTSAATRTSSGLSVSQFPSAASLSSSNNAISPSIAPSSPVGPALSIGVASSTSINTAVSSTIDMILSSSVGSTGSASLGSAGSSSISIASSPVVSSSLPQTTYSCPAADGDQVQANTGGLYTIGCDEETTGGGVLAGSSTDFNGCMTYCDQTPGCTAWTYNASCYLKTGASASDFSFQPSTRGTTTSTSDLHTSSLTDIQASLLTSILSGDPSAVVVSQTIKSASTIENIIASTSDSGINDVSNLISTNTASATGTLTVELAVTSNVLISDVVATSTNIEATTVGSLLTVPDPVPPSTTIRATVSSFTASHLTITTAISLSTTVRGTSPTASCSVYDNVLDICLDTATTPSVGAGGGINVGLGSSTITVVAISASLGIAPSVAPSVDLGVSAGTNGIGIGASATIGVDPGLSGSLHSSTRSSIPSMTSLSSRASLPSVTCSAGGNVLNVCIDAAITPSVGVGGNAGVGIVVSSSTITPSRCLGIIGGGPLSDRLSLSATIGVDLGLQGSSRSATTTALPTVSCSAGGNVLDICVDAAVTPSVGIGGNAGVGVVVGSSTITILDASASLAVVPSVTAGANLGLSIGSSGIVLSPSAAIGAGLNLGASGTITVGPILPTIIPSQTSTTNCSAGGNALNVCIDATITPSIAASVALNLNLGPSSSALTLLDVSASVALAPSVAAGLDLGLSVGSSGLALTPSATVGLDLGLGLGLGLGGSAQPKSSFTASLRSTSSVSSAPVLGSDFSSASPTTLPSSSRLPSATPSSTQGVIGNV
ncbi:unnamed protein product, partial [Aureobasidium pullulans]